MSVGQLRTFKRSMHVIFHNLETSSKRLDGESDVGIPVVPRCRWTGEGVTSYNSADFDFHRQRSLASLV